MVEGLTDQFEGYSTLQTLIAGGAELATTLSAKSAQQSLSNLAREIVENPSSANRIADTFKESGYNVTIKELSTGRGQQITINGFKNINTIKIHTGGGSHSLPRLQILGESNGKSVNYKFVIGARAAYTGNIAEEEAGGAVFIFLGN